MGATGNALTASFGFDLTPLKQSGGQAVSIAESVASKVKNALKQANSVPINWGNVNRMREQSAAFSGAFGPRTARNFRPAPRGKYPQPLDDEETATSRRIRGLGVGLTLISGIGQLAAWYEKVNEEADKLRKSIINLSAPKGSSAFRSDSGIQSHIGSITTLLDEIRQRDIEETQGGARTPAMTLGHLYRRARQYATGGSDAEDEEQKVRLRKQAVEAIDAMAGKQHDLNEAEREGFEGSERGAALLQAQIEHRERLGQLAEMEAKLGVNNAAARNEENARVTLVDKNIMRRFDLKKQEEEVENRILDLRASTLSKEEQSIGVLRERINLLKQEIGQPGTDEHKAALRTKLHGLQNEEFDQRFKAFEAGPGPMIDRQIAQRQVEAERKRFESNRGLFAVHRDMAGNVRSGQDPITGKRINLDDYPDPLAFTRTHMMPYGGSGEFNKAFGPGGSGGDKQGVGLLGRPGVLDRIETKLDGLGANK